LTEKSNEIEKRRKLTIHAAGFFITVPDTASHPLFFTDIHLSGRYLRMLYCPPLLVTAISTITGHKVVAGFKRVHYLQPKKTTMAESNTA